MQHPITWMGLTYSPAGTPVEIIDRARWLLDHQPPTYWVAHRNCEYIANWCATGDFESFQTKGAIAGKAILLDVPFILPMQNFRPRSLRSQLAPRCSMVRSQANACTAAPTRSLASSAVGVPFVTVKFRYVSR